MARLLRIYLVLALALVVTLTGHAATSMKGARDATGQMVICSGSGPVIVFVDNEGQPTRPPHFCPDCVMNLLDAVSVPDALALHSYGGQAFDRLWPARLQGHWTVVQALARAPPALG
ncbi:hypothetical protein [Pseudophaeobacter sp.]|uniref:hypothetical protein n=1 Tax=Pseudophaeobacter sp. TaxID=1971739 RepID=UPI00405A0DB8